MKLRQTKTLQILSNGSSFFNLTNNFGLSNQFLIFKKDYLQLSVKKTEINKDLKTKSLNTYKKKYLI